MHPGTCDVGSYAYLIPVEIRVLGVQRHDTAEWWLEREQTSIPGSKTGEF